MERVVVTVKGQVVIPSKLHSKYGIEKGTQVFVFDRDGEIIIKPITNDYIQSMAGMTKTKGKLLRTLAKEKARERKL